MENEFACLHVWPGSMVDFIVKPCEKCGAIRAHIQLLDDLEDAVLGESKAKGRAAKEYRDDRIAARGRILDLMRKAVTP